MKAPYILSVFLLLSCSKSSKVNRNSLTEPSDSVIKAAVIEKYTAQNNLDGLEFVAIDTLIILNKSLIISDSICKVEYHVQCSFTPAVRPPNQEQNAPNPIITNDKMTFYYSRNQWKVNPK